MRRHRRKFVPARRQDQQAGRPRSPALRSRAERKATAHPQHRAKERNQAKAKVKGKARVRAKPKVRAKARAKAKGRDKAKVKGKAPVDALSAAAIGPDGLSEDQRKAVQVVLSGMPFVLIGIKATDRGADFFTAIHGEASDLRNAQAHLSGVIDRAFDRKGI